MLLTASLTLRNKKYIGISITLDLPEKFLPHISSQMGIQRLCFGPYNYQQLQEIISSRLKGIDAFEKQAIEFASRQAAAILGDALSCIGEDMQACSRNHRLLITEINPNS